MTRTLVVCALLFAACTRPEDPIVLEAESLDGGTQWTSSDDASYSNHRAALTRAVNAIASTKVPELRKHNTWRAEVVVLNKAGAAPNVFELSLGGVTKQLTIGDPSLAEGLLRLDDLYFTRLADDTVRVRTIAIGQPALVIDRIRLFPEDIEPPKMITHWEQGAVCLRCVEAESLTADAGWETHAEPGYSGGRAAITRSAGAVAEGRIPRFRPAEAYRVSVAVHAEPAEKSALDLQVGKETQRITFSGANGIVLLKNIIFKDVSTNTLALRAGSAGFIVDAMSFEPLTSVPPSTQEPWTATEAEPIHTICATCVEAETMDGVSTDPNYGHTAGGGWAFYDQATYSGKRAALTRLPGAIMSTLIPNFRPGAYEVTVTVLNQDANENTFTITVDDRTETVAYGAKFAPGLLRLPPVRFDRVSNPTVTITAKSIGQPFLIIDRIDMRPTDR